MTKKLSNFVSILSHFRKICMVMELTAVLLLSGSVQIFASSFQQDDKVKSLNNVPNTQLLASVTTQSGSASQLVDLSKGKTTADDQQKIVTGRITGADGQALPGVNVLEKGTVNGAISDIDGKFTLTVASANSVLVFSFIGYTSQEVTVGSQATINITLAESATALEEIVVVGYGTQQKRAISGSVAKVAEKDFNAGITRSAADAIQGKVAGLTITTSTGDVTAEQSMRLRGTSSLTGSSEPFVVIDGVPGLSMSSVAPQDIESISVLKDASASAIYGSRSASGVILITTKKGAQNRTTVDYNGYVAFDFVSNKPDVLTSDEYRQWAADNNVNISVFDLGADTDWFDEIMRTGVSQNHDISVSGAGANNNYRVSVSYLDQEGVMMDNWQKRLNTRFVINQKALEDRLDLSLTGGLNEMDYQPSATNNFVLAYNVVPTIPVKYDDGTWWDSDEYDQGNPVRNMTYNKDDRKSGLLFVNGKANLLIFEGFTAGINFYKERSTYDRGYYLDSTTRWGRASNGTASRTSSTSDKNLLEATLNYARKFGRHDVSLLGGYSYEDFYSQTAFAQNRYFVTNLFGYNNLGAGEQLLTGDVTSSAYMYKLISFFGRVNYSLADRYIISATLRRDGSSKFGPNNKWGTFPSVSAAWRLIDEPFMQGLKGWMDELKLRVGYGVSGNQSGLASYQSLALYGTSGLYWDNGAWHTAYAVSQNPNPDLKWESTSQFNIGVDFSLFKARLNGTVEYYNRLTNDLLYNYPVPVPPYLYSTIAANVGSMENKGIELTLSGDVIRKSNFRWTMSFNAAHNANKITSLSNEEFTTSVIKTGSAWVRGGSTNTTHIIQEGYQVGQFFGPECLGIDDAGKYIINDMIDGIAGFTVADYTYIGEAQPIMTFGFSNNITYKNLDLSFFFRGVLGNDVLNFSKMSYANLQWLPGANCLKVALDMGLKQSPFYNSYYIEDGSFARLDNLTLSYSLLPKDMLGVSRIRFYGTMHNLITITNYKGVDPEVPMGGLDPGIEGREYYPKTKTYILGINVTF